MQIPIDTSDVLSLPPSVVIYGAPGGGKTFSVAHAFPGVLYVQSSPTILRAWADHVVKHPEQKLSVPQRVTLDETTLKQYYGGSMTTAVMTVAQQFITACEQGTCPYTGIVFDEWNTICERAYAEMKTDPWNAFKGRNGKLNIFAVMDYFKGWHSQMLSISRRTRRIVAFVSHYQGPKMDEDENSPTKGQLKWPGGPMMPVGLSSEVTKLCADADVVLQLAVKEPPVAPLNLLGGTAQPAQPAESIGGALSLVAAQPTAPLQPAAPSPGAQRVFLTSLDPKWLRKVRGFGIKDEEPINIERGQGLRELLRRANYPV